MERNRSFPGISPSAWEHPADKAALAAFSSLPLAGELVRRIVGSTTERSLRLSTLANSARASDSQFASLYASLGLLCERLDCAPRPELYIRLDPSPNAFALGVDRPFIVLTSGALDLWGEEELGSVLAHELGHVLSGHVVFKTLLVLLIKASSLLVGNLPLAGAALSAAIAALKEWDRKSELSADRASLLAVQDAPLVLRSLMKSAGGARIGQMDLNEFFRQAHDYESSREGLDSLYKLVDVLGESHPYPVARMTALQEWEKSPAYASILAGDYPRRGQEGERDAARDFQEAGKAYSSEFSSSEDPLSQAAGKVMETLGGLFGGAGKGRPGGGGGGGEGSGSATNIEETADRIFGKRP
ncbi:MAG TPA: M48 family metallopeptidase [Spirochaetales bacterium]|nr:M48 family metallopeptidase [Spirochaetales bacterium]